MSRAVDDGPDEKSALPGEAGPAGAKAMRSQRRDGGEQA